MSTQSAVMEAVSSQQDACILLVDDNPTNLQVLLQTLNGRGYKLLIAKNGESALRIARKAKPEVILLDIMMPGLDGYEVCEQLKAEAETSRITIIFLSALGETKDKVHGLELGAVDFITKPFQPDEVIARLETQLKIHKLESALEDRNRQLEAQNQSILESMNEGIFGVDMEANITFANPAACQMGGWEINQVIGKSLHHLCMHSLEGGMPVSLEESPLYITLRTSEGQNIEDGTFWNNQDEPFPVDYSCSPITQNDETHGAVIAFKDISERKKQQQALQSALGELEEQKEKLTHTSRLSMMGEMAAGFAHEVNQPLTAISNYAQVCMRFVQREPIDKEVLTTTLDKISLQARRAGDIIARIRSFVKKPEHILKPTDCNKLIRDVIRLAEVDARNNCMEIDLQQDPTLPQVYVDAVQIQQVALNLIRNGMESMIDIESKENIVVSTKLLENHYVRVTVTDQGSGLPEDAEEKLFTPFYTTKETGMGIGLSICESIINSHGGKLNFIRNPNGGTSFWFTIPTV